MSSFRDHPYSTNLPITTLLADVGVASIDNCAVCKLELVGRSGVSVVKSVEMLLNLICIEYYYQS